MNPQFPSDSSTHDSRFIAVLETGALLYMTGSLPELTPVEQSSPVLPVIGDITWWSGLVPGLSENVHVQVVASPSSMLDLPAIPHAREDHGWKPVTEIIDGSLPAPVGGVSVAINGKPAAIYLVSPGKIHLSGPAEVVTGLVRVTVKNGVGTLLPNQGRAVCSLLPGFLLLKRAGRRVELLGAAFSPDRSQALDVEALQNLTHRGRRSVAVAA